MDPELQARPSLTMKVRGQWFSFFFFSPCVAFGVGEAEVAIAEPPGLWLLLSVPMSGIGEFICTLYFFSVWGRG